MDDWLPVLVNGTRLLFVENCIYQSGIVRCRNGTRLLFSRLLFIILASPSLDSHENRAAVLKYGLGGGGTGLREKGEGVEDGFIF